MSGPARGLGEIKTENISLKVSVGAVCAAPLSSDCMSGPSRSAGAIIDFLVCREAESNWSRAGWPDTEKAFLSDHPLKSAPTVKEESPDLTF